MNTTNNMRCIALAVALLGTAVAGNANAQSWYEGSSKDGYNPSWYLAPSINGMDPDSGFGTDHRGIGAGLRLGKPLSQMWDIQFGPTYSRTHDGDVQYRQNTLGLDALLMFSRDRFRPFILAGMGAEYDKVNRPDLRADHTSPYANLGIGFQYSFTDQLGMQADLRRSYTFLRNADFGFDHANTNILTLGLTYAFSKPPAPAPVARAEPAPAPVVEPPAPASPPPPPAPRFERYTLSSTELFSFNSADLRTPQPKLDEIANVLTRNTEISNVTITGHTDRLGSDKYNMRLSQRRADAVKTYLVNKGVEGTRLTTVAKGKSQPVVECSNRKRAELIACLEPNRRVEVEEIVIERPVK